MGFLEAFMDREIIIRAIRVSAVIGTLLVAINQGDLILLGLWPPLWKVLLTYGVPFGVSSYSATQHKRFS
ncbi:MAG: hypothetical protein D6757_05650 [Alphaproteobacteria bacterium]|nr:MAG: hypothetical protein D6757_05650 [Alphaproteobacteria bacterium]